MTGLAPVAHAPDRPWFAAYPPGVPREVDPATLVTLNELFDRSVKAHGRGQVIESFGVALTYAALGETATAIAAWLQSVGVAKGDRVAIMLPNVAAYLPIVFGVLRAGAIVVNVNPLYTAPELTHQFKDSGTKTVFVLAQFEHTVKAATQAAPVDRVVRVHLGDLLGLKGRLVTYFGGKKSPIQPGGRIAGAFDFANIVAQGKRCAFKPVKVEPADIAFIQYTGGTTGVAKGAALRHSNLTANIEQIRLWFAPFGGHEAGALIMIAPLPLYHIYALTVTGLYMVASGGCSILITNPRDIPAFIKTLRSRRFTFFAGINTLCNALADAPGIKSVDFSHLTVTTAGGMATHAAVSDKWQALTGMPLLEGYGLSETSPMISLNRPDNTTFTGTVGYPWPSTDVSIRHIDSGAELPVGEIGEVCVKGPQVMAGYWNRPDETAKVMTTDGYFRTGDMGVLLPDGQLRLVDRLKEMIIVSGFNVYPNEIEDVIAKHPKVREVAVIGLPDMHSGEAVTAYVVRRDDTLTADDVRAFCALSLTKYKVPKVISFRAELPKSPVGKVLRRVLRDEVMGKTAT